MPDVTYCICRWHCVRRSIILTGWAQQRPPSLHWQIDSCGSDLTTVFGSTDADWGFFVLRPFCLCWSFHHTLFEWQTESEEREISSPSAVLSHPSCSSLCSFIHRLLVCLNDGMFGQFEMTAEHLGEEFSILYKHFRLMQLDWVSARNVNATFAEVRRGDVYKGKNDEKKSVSLETC